MGLRTKNSLTSDRECQGMDRNTGSAFGQFHKELEKHMSKRLERSCVTWKVGEENQEIIRANQLSSGILFFCPCESLDEWLTK